MKLHQLTSLEFALNFFDTYDQKREDVIKLSELIDHAIRLNELRFRIMGAELCGWHSITDEDGTGRIIGMAEDEHWGEIPLLMDSMNLLRKRMIYLQGIRRKAIQFLQACDGDSMEMEFAGKNGLRQSIEFYKNNAAKY